MIPEINEIIFSYLESLEKFSNLPSLETVRRIVRQSDSFVMTILGSVLRLQAYDIAVWRYKIRICENFHFFFRLNNIQRLRLQSLLQLGMLHNKPTCILVWLFVHEQSCSAYPEYRDLFLNSMFSRMLGHLRL